jgi:membrane protein DedA with SNARE-associated domain
MFEKLLEPLVKIFLEFGEKNGYLAIFLGAIADSLIPIVPSEIVFGSAGFWAYKGYINIPLAILIAVLGNLIASAIFWYLGKRYGHNFLIKYGKYFGFNDKDMVKAESVFSKWGYWSVFICQFIPLFRSLISIPSGVLELDFKKFMFATAIGAGIWNGVLMILAYQLGEKWSQVAKIASNIGKPLFLVVSLGLVIFVIYYIYKLYKNKKVPNVK